MAIQFTKVRITMTWMQVSRVFPRSLFVAALLGAGACESATPDEETLRAVCCQLADPDCADHEDAGEVAGVLQAMGVDATKARVEVRLEGTCNDESSTTPEQQAQDDASALPSATADVPVSGEPHVQGRWHQSCGGNSEWTCCCDFDDDWALGIATCLCYPSAPGPF